MATRPAANEPAPDSLHRPLARPPMAHTLNVRRLLGRVRDGSIRVPPFQRELRWRADDVTKLFDSILKGYPIGSLLFWKRPLPATTDLTVGSARIGAPAVQDGWMIVDGQQRTTALAASMLDLDQHDDPRWTIRFDPLNGVFLSGPVSSADVTRHVPLTILGDLRRLGRWLRDCSLDEDAQRRLEEVQQRILEYEIPSYLVDSDDEDALRGVFARLNSTGVRMRADEVFHALLGGATPHHRAPSVDLVALQAACDLDGFGQPPRGEVLKALLAMSNLDPTRRLEDLGEDVGSKLTGSFDATEALRRAVAFLQAPVDSAEPGAGIPAYAFLPYPVVFVILAKWFAIFPEVDAGMRRGLARWVWRGVVTGVHQRAAVSPMRHQVRHIREDASASLRRLLDEVNVRGPVTWSVLDPFHANHAASRVELLTLLDRGPLDRSGPVSWRALLSDGERVAREIIRSESWRKQDRSTRDAARTVANRALLDARHTGLRAEFSKWRWATDQAALESHLFDEPSFEHLQSRDVPAFLARRGERVRAEVVRFLARRVGEEEPLLLPIESYYDALPGADR